MPRFDPIFTNFSAGELSPFLYGRVDIENYRSGCEIMENYIPRPHGPVVRRGGTRFIGKAKFPDQQCRLIPFDTGAGAGLFHLEFGNLYIRFFTQDGQLEDPPGTPYEIVSPYLEAELFSINFIQDANNLYIGQNNHAPRTLVRNDTYNWSLTPITFTAQPPEWVAGNYPNVFGFFEERMYFSGCPANPGQIWASTVGDYFNLTTGTQDDDDAFTYTIATEKINNALWMSPGEVLAMGATGGEFKISSTDFREPITPTNINIRRQTNYGSGEIDPIRIGPEVIFVQKGGLKVRSFKYDIERDGYIAEDLTILSEHIFKNGVEESDYSNEPDSIAWFVRKDGQVAGLIFEPELNIKGWFRLASPGASGVIESVSVTDGWSDIRQDDIYFVVKRNILGADVRYIEKLEPPLDREATVEDSFYVDSGLTYDGAPISVVAGLDHLEGETVQVLTDGSVHPDRVVSSGQITLQYEASKIHAGLGFESTLKTMRVEGGNPIGTGQGKIKRVNRTQVRIYRTVGIVVNGERFFMGPPVMNQAVELQSGDIEVPIDDGYEEEGQITIVQNQPLPSTIIAIMPEVRTQ